jgi:PAS domain S-box-containing protein
MKGMKKRDSSQNQSILEIMDDFNAAYYSVTLDGTLLAHNQFFNSIFGLETGLDLKGTKMVNFWQDPDEREAYLEKLITNGFISSYLINMKKINGDEIFIMVNSHVVNDEYGKPVRIDGIFIDFTRQIQVQEALRRSEEKYLNIFENVQDAYFETLIDGTILESSPAVKIISRGQYQRDDLIGKSILNLYSEPKVRQALIDLLLEREAVSDYEMTLRNRDGSVIPCSVSAKLCYDSHGRTEKIIGSMRDITYRKLAEKALNQERRKLRSLIDNLPALIYIKDNNCRRIMANKADVKNLGFQEEEEVVGRTDIELLPCQTGHRGFTDDKKVINSGKAIIDHEEYFVDNKGLKHWLLTSKIPIVDDDEKIIGLIGIGHDITERKLIEEELIKSRAQLLNAHMIARLGSWEYDVDTDIFTFNDPFYAIFHTTAELEGGYKMGSEEYAKRFLLPDDISLVSSAILKAGESNCSDYNRQLEHRFLYADGGIGCMSVRVFIIKDENGKIMKTYGVNQDITEQKAIEAELRKAKEKAEESDRLKTAFLNNISHEIRTPMNAIVGFSALLGEPDVELKSRQSYIDVIIQSTNHLLEIIEDIIDVSRIEANIVKIEKNEININLKLKSLCSQFLIKSNEKRIDLLCETKIPDSDAFILTDGVKLTQILIKLINNAIKFTDKGYVKVTCELKDPFLEFCVSDTGIGLAQEYHKKIFDRFYQVEDSLSRFYEGTGLGLAISKAKVELLGGKIWLTSEPGKGSSFFFTIPYERQVTKTIVLNEEKVGEGFVFPVKKTILVAEDVDTNFTLINSFLSKTNANILKATNGKEAVEKYLSNKSIDLILMDIKMPVMDGYSAIKLIRERNSSVPIIAQTAYADERERAIQLGCSGFISKPFNKKQLLKIICEFIL